MAHKPFGCYAYDWWIKQLNTRSSWVPSLVQSTPPFIYRSSSIGERYINISCTLSFGTKTNLRRSDATREKFISETISRRKALSTTWT
jgi:hypothetical protein